MYIPCYGILDLATCTGLRLPLSQLPLRTSYPPTIILIRFSLSHSPVNAKVFTTYVFSVANIGPKFLLFMALWSQGNLNWIAGALSVYFWGMCLILEITRSKMRLPIVCLFLMTLSSRRAYLTTHHRSWGSKPYYLIHLMRLIWSAIAMVQLHTLPQKQLKPWRLRANVLQFKKYFICLSETIFSGKLCILWSAQSKHSFFVWSKAAQNLPHSLCRPWADFTLSHMLWAALLYF